MFIDYLKLSFLKYCYYLLPYHGLFKEVEWAVQRNVILQKLRQGELVLIIDESLLLVHCFHCWDLPSLSADVSH